MEDEIAILDAHHHFWNLDENYYPWRGAGRGHAGRELV